MNFFIIWNISWLFMLRVLMPVCLSLLATSQRERLEFEKQ
jgi:hypothetical protein